MRPSAIVSNIDSEPQERVSSPSTGYHIPSPLQHTSFIALVKSRPSQLDQSSSPLAACGSLTERSSLVLDIVGQCELGAGCGTGSAGSCPAGSCHKSLGSNADLEGLFFLLLIISLLCPPMEAPLLNCCPDFRCSLVITHCPRLNPRWINRVSLCSTSSHKGQPLQ